MQDWRPSVKGLDLLFLDGCYDQYEYYLNQMGEVEREQYLKYQDERLEVIKAERRQHEKEKEARWKKHKKSCKCYSSQVDKYYESLNDQQ